MEKLVKYVARLSAYSRRKSEALIKSGKVRVNGVIVKDLSAPVSEEDSLSINDEILKTGHTKLYVALNKPDGYISDLQDPRGRNIARNLIKTKVKLFPVGRLDYHSEGLMIFTNDGDFANMIMHPRYEVEKEYLVKVKGSFTKNDVLMMKKGILINGEKYRIEEIRFLQTAKKSSFHGKEIALMKRDRNQRTFKKEDATDREIRNTWYSIIINEGKNRMIRKIGDAMRHPVLKLKRIRIGRLELGDLQPGKYRYFEGREALGNVTGEKKKNV